MIKLKFPGDKATIYSNSAKLKGKENSKKKLYFIQDDYTEEQAEQRRYCSDLVKENRELDENECLTIKI